MYETITRIVLLSIITALILAGIYVFAYSEGLAAGTEKALAQQAERLKAEKIEYDKLMQELSDQAVAQAQKQEQVSYELVQARKAYAAAMSTQRSTFEQRLLQSARRAEVYRDQAEASSAYCRDLASRAAQLDRALEEGRGLVEEFRETLGLRDHQLTLLGQQIENDRRFFAGEAGSTK